MRRLVTILLLGVALTGFPVRGDDVLLWWVSYEDSVSDFADPSVVTVNDLISRPDGYQVNGVRIRVGDVGSSEYLPMIVGEPGDYEVGGTIAFWDRDYEEAGPAWADLSRCEASDVFTIELGYFDVSENWTVMAVGETASYEALRKFINHDIVDVPGYIPWTSSYTVPEPSSGLLFIVGGAFLALRRRTRRLSSRRS